MVKYVGPLVVYKIVDLHNYLLFFIHTGNFEICLYPFSGNVFVLHNFEWYIRRRSTPDFSVSTETTQQPLRLKIEA